MAQELLDVGTGRVYRRAGAGWQEVLQGETDAAMLSELGVGELLWEGEFMSGSITVPGIGDYAVLAVTVTGEFNVGQTGLLYMSDELTDDGKYSLVGGYNSLGSGGDVLTLGYAMKVAPGTDEVTSTFERPGYLYFARTSVKWSQGISKIFGLVKKAGDMS